MVSLMNVLNNKRALNQEKVPYNRQGFTLNSPILTKIIKIMLKFGGGHFWNLNKDLNFALNFKTHHYETNTRTNRFFNFCA